MARLVPLARVVVVISIAATLASSPLSAAGFSIFEQGAKSMGMAGAFTAQADDPSAMYYNIGGLAFLDGHQVAVGTTLITQTESSFSGAGPVPGRGADGERTDSIFFPSHLYTTHQIAPRWRAGFALNNPFGLATEWKNPDTWPGRAISYDAEMRTFDLTGGYGWTGRRIVADVALMYLAFDTVNITPADGQIDGFYGTYKSTGWLLGTTLTWR